MKSSPKVFESLKDWQKYRKSLSESLGFVPTMGALHEGHLSLVRRSKKENAKTLVSIFVNPTQFNDPSDLENYPKTFESDLEKLTKEGADFLLFPKKEELYKDQYRFRVIERELSEELCGRERPGHFDGVLTIVLKLLNLAQATRAYFGEKDYQQLSLVRDMAEAFFVPTQIIGCPTVRDSEGLALSSRNQLLSKTEYERSLEFPRILRTAKNSELAKRELSDLGFKVDYVEEKFGRRFGAVRIGNVRLIDNIEAQDTL